MKRLWMVGVTVVVVGSLSWGGISWAADGKGGGWFVDWWDSFGSGDSEKVSEPASEKASTPMKDSSGPEDYKKVSTEGAGTVDSTGTSGSGGGRVRVLTTTVPVDTCENLSLVPNGMDVFVKRIPNREAFFSIEGSEFREPIFNSLAIIGASGEGALRRKVHVKVESLGLGGDTQTSAIHCIEIGLSGIEGHVSFNLPFLFSGDRNRLLENGFRVIVDPLGEIMESNEENNEFTCTRIRRVCSNSSEENFNVSTWSRNIEGIDVPSGGSRRECVLYSSSACSRP